MITLEDVRNYLDITYEDEDIDRKLTGIMTRAEAHVRELAAAEENELTDTESQLVLDCCRYIWNDAFEDFANNFLGTVNGARAKREIAAAEVDDSG